MKLTFDRQEIENILLDHAKKMGVELNTVSWGSYSSTPHEAILSFDALEEKNVPEIPS